jgi:hypothetical protein
VVGFPCSVIRRGPNRLYPLLLLEDINRGSFFIIPMFFAYIQLRVMSVAASCVCAEIFVVGVRKLYSIPSFIITCSVQKCVYFHNIVCYSHLFYFFTKFVQEILCDIEVLLNVTLSLGE